jgi:hypothetical protein
MTSAGQAISMIAVAVSHATMPSAQEVKTDYDHNANFTQYKTFWFAKIRTKDPLWVDRISSALSAVHTEKGLSQVSSGGDISIVAIEMTKDEQTLDTFYENYANGWGWRWGGGYGEATTTPEVCKVGTLVVDLFDAASKKLIWRGSESDALSNQSSKSTKNFDKRVDKFFKEFPPKT